MENTLALNAFLNANDLEPDGLARTRFTATVTVRGFGVMEETQVTARGHSGDNEQIKIDETGDLIAGQVPLGYSTEFGDWVCSGKELHITGVYKNKSYTTKISL